MLEMKQPPRICMKTQATVTKCLVKNKAFTWGHANCAIFDSNRSDFLTKMHRLHDNPKCC